MNANGLSMKQKIPVFVWIEFGFRTRKMLENQLNLGTDRTEMLEIQLKEARRLATESDKKYEEVARKLLVQENDLEKVEDRAKRSEM